MNSKLYLYFQCIFLFLFYSLSNGYAQEHHSIVELSAATDNHIIESAYLELLEDKTNSLSIEEIISDSIHHRFKKSIGEYAKIEHTDYTYWARVSITGDILASSDWLVESMDSHFDLFEIYIIKNDSIIHIGKMGDEMAFNARNFIHKNFLIDIPAWAAQTPVQFYFKGKSKQRNVFLLKVWKINSFMAYALNEYYILGCFYGILFIMALYNLLNYFSFKEKMYLYYVAYVCAAAVLAFMEDSLGYQYLWPNNYQINSFFTVYATSIFMITFVIYSSSFLRLHKVYPKLNQQLFGLTMFIALLKVGNYNFERDYLFNIPSYVIPFIIIYALAIRRLLQGYRPARFFVLGFSFILVGLLFNVIRNFGFETSSILVIYSLNIGVVAEILAFSMALSDRVKVLKEEHTQAQQRAIEKLKENEKIIERKVQERTKEINEQQILISHKNEELLAVNDKLNEQTEQLLKQTEEINRMNNLLNEENKKLYDDVSELRKAHVFHKKVDFKEFREIFPDDNSCYAYLEKLKWEHGYNCKKCNSKTYSPGQGNLARRCTKCGFNESSTNGTLFHRNHIPMVKAFYMLFLIFASKGEISSTELSKVLDIRQSTCWKFKKKVDERLKHAKNSSGQDALAELIINQDVGKKAIQS